MPVSRDLGTNSKKALDRADKLVDFTTSELAKAYKSAMDDIRARLAKLYEGFTTSEPTKAQLTQLMRQSGILDQLSSLMAPYLDNNEELIKTMSFQAFDDGFFNNAWSVDQAIGVNQSWSQFDDTAVRAAAGIGGDIGGLTAVISAKEAKKHFNVLEKAFVNYDKDSQKKIRQAVRQSIIQGESIPNATKRIQQALDISYSSAERIARTEILRSTGLGGQAAYDQARGNGVEIIETWDATLDSRTRASHAAADGTQKDNVTGLYDLFGGVPGPRRTGDASEDINCRCVSVGEVSGLSPELRALKDEGTTPYQSFEQWATSQGITTNRFGEKYNFKGV